MTKPNYNNLGLSYPMGDQLRNEVVKQLNEDLKYYGINDEVLKYDWSESVVEGRCANVLGSHIDNFSDIKVFNLRDEIIGEGWINFIFEEEFNIFICYWDQLEIYDEGILKEIKKFGIPEHIINKLPIDLKKKYSK